MNQILQRKRDFKGEYFVCLSQCPWSIGHLSVLQKLLHHQFIFICVFLGLGIPVHACTVNNRMPMEVLKIEKYTFTGISKTGGKQCHSIVQKIIRSSVIFSNYASLVECFHGFDKEITAVFLYPGINTSIFLSSKNVFSQSLGWKFFFFSKFSLLKSMVVIQHAIYTCNLL